MEERRKDYPEILDELRNIRTEMTKVATQVEERNNSALIWRADVCKKFDKIFNWLEKLPCRTHILNNKYLWGAIVVIFGILVAHLGWK